MNRFLRLEQCESEDIGPEKNTNFDKSGLAGGQEFKSPRCHDGASLYDSVDQLVRSSASQIFLLILQQRLASVCQN